MASNSFGKIFRITTWGESHGKAIGVVIDGCPAGLELRNEDINRELRFRAPGKSPYTSPRNEKDEAEIYSGVFEGKTTGAPISIIIFNHDVDSTKYEATKQVYKPGHAHFSYMAKYGIFDYRGGGRASARETACRVAAGAVAKKFLKQYNIKPIAYIKEIGGISADIDYDALSSNTLYCPDPVAEKMMMEKIEEAKQRGDSLGGVVELYVDQIMPGLGDPVYEKLEANLAAAFMGLPATKGFEIGSGFQTTKMQGSEHNDRFVYNEGEIKTLTNHAGGVLAGISTGMPIVARIAFKPASSIQMKQQSVDHNGKEAFFELPPGSRHDPCVAIRAVPVVEAMAALVLADAVLFNWCARV